MLVATTSFFFDRLTDSTKLSAKVLPAKVLPAKALPAKEVAVVPAVLLAVAPTGVCGCCWGSACGSSSACRGACDSAHGSTCGGACVSTRGSAHSSAVELVVALAAVLLHYAEKAGRLDIS
jgi:hypothetical protein